MSMIMEEMTSLYPFDYNHVIIRDFDCLMRHFFPEESVKSQISLLLFRDILKYWFTSMAFARKRFRPIDDVLEDKIEDVDDEMMNLFFEDYQLNPSKVKSNFSNNCIRNSKNFDNSNQYSAVMPSISNVERPSRNATRSTNSYLSKNICKMQTTMPSTSKAVQGKPSSFSMAKSTASKSKSLVETTAGDVSLFFCTSSISAIRQWKRYRDEVQMIIEIFGTLESVKPDLRYASGKWLVLADQGNALRCIYHEIDRKLPALNLKQWLRCVGIIQKDGSLLCLSARPATQEEHQWRNKLTSFGAKAMYMKMAELNEI